MASRFVGRDYTTLRTEIIDFLRQRLSNEWDYTNLSDPIIIFAECLAMAGDQLHFIIDELRRECDMATAKRASSVYSYAMREGYKMFLPRGSFGNLLVNSREQSDRLFLSVNKFDEIKVPSTGSTLVVADSVSGTLHKPFDREYADELLHPEDGDYNSVKGSYAEYADSVNSRTIRIPVVLGTKDIFNFTYNDINDDSTVDLPETFIDRDLVLLERHSNRDGDVTLLYVDDIIGSGFNRKSYTITPKFIGGAITLSIEFPTNYRDLFDSSDTFSFTFVKIKDVKIEDTPENGASINLDSFIKPAEGHADDADIVEGYKYTVSLADGIKGYSEFENPNVTRENYKKFVQNYSALLTKDDYASYIKATRSQHCQVFDHADNYKTDKVPPGTSLIPRTVYILTDSDYDGRADLWKDLTERSSRSDCIVLIPYGKDPYSIVVKAECYLLGTSIASIATQIKSAILQYYSGDIGERVPEISMINYLVHKASDKVIRMDSCIVRDNTFGTTDKTFKDVALLDNDDIDKLYDTISGKQIDADMYNDYMIEYVVLDHDTPVTLEYFNSHPDEFTAYADYDDYITVEFPEFKAYQEANPGATYDDFVDYAYKVYYVKYIPHTYNPYPDEFTKIYYAPDANTEVEITDYDGLIQYQVDYGLLDRSDWDVKNDADIFELTDNRESDPAATPPASLDISPHYIKHHYMVPVLNNVIVLIKAVTR